MALLAHFISFVTASYFHGTEDAYSMMVLPFSPSARGSLNSWAKRCQEYWYVEVMSFISKKWLIGKSTGTPIKSLISTENKAFLSIFPSPKPSDDSYDEVLGSTDPSERRGSLFRSSVATGGCEETANGQGAKCRYQAHWVLVPWESPRWHPPHMLSNWPKNSVGACYNSLIVQPTIVMFTD